MPSIQVNRNPAKPDEWVEIIDYQFDNDGYLTIFSVEAPDGSAPLDFHLHRTSLLTTATQLFGAATSLRSGRDLLKELEKHASDAGWWEKNPMHGKIAGRAGIVFAGAAALHEFLRTRPFRAEGYYGPSGQLSIAGSISKTSRHFRR